jgi:hypothetical protein
MKGRPVDMHCDAGKRAREAVICIEERWRCYEMKGREEEML